MSTKNTTTKTTKASAKEATASGKGTTQKQQQAVPPDVDLPAGESVTRYELLGACDFVLVDPAERLPEEARQALFTATNAKYVSCTVQCEGYVFNIVALPYVEFMGLDGKVTGSSRRASWVRSPPAAPSLIPPAMRSQPRQPQAFRGSTVSTRTMKSCNSFM